MAVALEQPDVISSMQETLAAMPVPKPLPRDNAIDSTPILGTEVVIRLSLSPGMLALIAAPATVLVTMLVGWLFLKTAGLPVYAAEMFAGGIVNALGGVAASIPLFILMRKGTGAIAQAGLFGIAMRCGMILMGLMAAAQPAWGLAKMPLVWWVLGFYFPLLMAETAVVAWLANKAKH
jgi:hypothetical protein